MSATRTVLFALVLSSLAATNPAQARQARTIYLVRHADKVSDVVVLLQTILATTLAVDFIV